MPNITKLKEGVKKAQKIFESSNVSWKTAMQKAFGKKKKKRKSKK